MMRTLAAAAAALFMLLSPARADVIPMQPPPPEAFVEETYMMLSSTWEGCSTFGAGDGMIWRFSAPLLTAFAEGRDKVTEGPYLDFDPFTGSQDRDRITDKVATKVLKNDGATAEVEARFPYLGGERAIVYKLVLTPGMQWRIDDIVYGGAAGESTLRELIVSASGE
jgi:hypothetical protein